MQLVLAQEVAQREVVELDTHTTNDTCLSPTQRQLQLVVGLLLQVPVDIHGTVLVVGFHIGTDGLSIEITHLGYLTIRTHQRLLGEEVTRLGTQLTTYHFLVQTVVTIDVHLIQVGLRTFLYAHLQIDAVTHDVNLSRLDLREHITIIIIVVAHSIIIFLQALFYQLLVVHIAFLHAEDIVQTSNVTYSIGGIDGVSYPGDVADIVFVALVNLHKDVHVLVVLAPDRVLDDGSIAETQLVVFLQQLLLGLFETFGGVLLGLEEIGELACLMNLAKGALGEEATLDLAVRQLLVAFEDNVANLHLLFLVDIDIENHLVLACHVIALTDIDLHILEALVLKVLTSQNLSTVSNILCQRHTLGHTQLRLHVLALALLDAIVVNLADTRTQGQVDAEIDLGIDDGVGCDADFREQTMLPIALHGLGNLATWDVNHLSHRQSGEVGQHIVLITFDTFDGQTCNLTLARGAGIADLGVFNLVLRVDA